MNHHILFGFDFGLKRIGVAIGQTITQSARPLETIAAVDGEPHWQSLDALFKKYQPDGLVIGLPLNMDGTEQPITQHAKAFADKLKEKYQLPVYIQDERLTTKAAREQLFEEGGYKALQSGKVDQIAAKLILENWFQR